MSKLCPKKSVLCSSVRPLLIVALLVSLVVALPSPRATADVGITAGTTITVDIETDTVENDGHCSLREAISAANLKASSGLATGECPAGSGNDTIVLPSGTYNLAGAPGEDNNATGDLDIKSSLAIQGVGSDTTVIDGGHNDRVLHIVSGSVDISGVRIRNGTVTSTFPLIGGGIFNSDDGALSLKDVVVHHNTARYYSGGIYSVGPATLTGTTLRDNKATEAHGGGYYGGGVLTVTDSTIQDNTAGGSGGGLYNPVAMITLTNSTVRENRATGFYGGGLSCHGLTMTDSAVVTNTASRWGGGISTGTGAVTLTNSNVNGNTAGADGGGIEASGSGTVTLTNSNVNGNTAGDDGGGIWATGVGLTMTDSHVDDNTAGGEGGGIWSAISFTMENGTVSGNEAEGGPGGGVYASEIGPGSLVEMRGVIVSRNKTTGAYGHGGGVYCSGPLNIQDSTVTDNTASTSGGGIWGYSTVNVEDSTIKGNTAGSSGVLGRGGGIAGEATLTVNGSTISGNKARGLFGYGGGISSESHLALTNSTLSGNRADESGGGLFKVGGTTSGTLSNVTIADNTADDDGDGVGNGGGMYRAGTLIVINSLIANNKSSGSNNDCYLAAGTLTSKGYNLVETPDATCAYDASTCLACFGLPGSNDVTGQDAKLAALADNGGSTWTQALQSGSPALDKIPNGTNGCGISPLDVDQRGFTRPRPTGDSCDMGAYETQSALIYVPAVLRQ